MKNEIFSVGYRTMPGDRATRWAPWPIARTALLLAWRRRATKIALMVCGFVAVGHGVQIVAKILFERADLFAGKSQMMIQSLVGSSQETFAVFVRTQFFFTAIAMAVIAAGFIAEDRRAGAFELYFARPLTRRDYIVGKLLGAGLIPTATLIAPFVLMWVIAVGIAPPVLRGELSWLLIPGLTGVIAASLVLTTTIVGLSALGERGRTVGVAYVVALFILMGVGEGLSTTSGFEWAGYIAPERNIRTITEYLLDIGYTSLATDYLSIRRSEANSSVLFSAVGIVGYIAAGAGALWWRIRREVVG